MLRTTMLASALALGGLGLAAGGASAASSSPFACDQPARGGGVALQVAIPADRTASVPVPRDCFAGRAPITVDAAASGTVTPVGGDGFAKFVRFTPAPGATGVVTLRFRTALPGGGGEQRVAVDVGGAGAAPDVVAIGDSVTAAFGYCGARDVCGPGNSSVNNSWLDLKDCNQEAEFPKLPENLCSNNRRGGLPWQNDGATSGDVAYAAQFGRWLGAATEEAGLGSAPAVRNWGVSGARPAHWDSQPVANDPTNKNNTPGGFSRQTGEIRESLVVMTLGANKLLADFLSFDFAYPAAWFADTKGDYAKCTGARGWIWGYEEAGRDRLRRCFEQDWAVNKQGEHLTSVYTQLLEQGNRVLVLGYHLACPTTFGTWQQMNFFAGPASATACTSKKGDNGMSQWDQAAYVSGLLNDAIRDAVTRAQATARTRWPQERRDGRIAFVDTASLDPWAQHQSWDDRPWVFPNDTGIHPSRAGHAVMAKNVAEAACGQLGLFCTQHAALAPSEYPFPGRSTNERRVILIASSARARGVDAGATGSADATAAAVENDAVVARVGTTEITAGQVRRMGRLLNDDARDPSRQTAAEALKTLITGAQVRAEARRLGIAIPAGAALTRATKRFGGGSGARGLAAEQRYVTASVLLSQRVGDRLVGAPEFPTLAEGRAYAAKNWRGTKGGRMTTAVAREALFSDRVEQARERTQTLVDRRYRGVTHCTKAAAGNRACSTQHGAWTW
ncbi:MAG TPA: hypothetical protein VLK58_22990 [Conexibacter sp.]|nr:hypothetical protein [Conexibacter sp.]